ncbi:hypothetical protein [Promicromonospora sp. NPDC023987]|uniref:hypothetical protein n=1 Tax=Promicromonospora sp. NPDC023987 TaxID=3155360 RepID=UPI0033D33FCA
MRKRYLVAGVVSSVVYVVVGPFLTILSLLAATRAGQPEEDVLPIGIVFGWVLFAGPLTLFIVATALLGEVCARSVRRTTRKLLIVSLVSAVLLFGTAALLSASGDAFLADWSSMSLTLLPGWLLAGAGPRFWSWIAEPR